MIDLTHGVPRHDVRAGAVIARAARCRTCRSACTSRSSTPTSAADRRGRRAAARATGGCSSDPTTGCCRRRPSAPAASSRRSTSLARRSRSSRVSATFHGRDIFAPVAARLAGGARARGGRHAVRSGWAGRARATTRASSSDRVARGARPLHRPVRQRPARRRRSRISTRGAVACGRADRRAAGARSPPVTCSTFADAGAGELLLYEDASPAGWRWRSTTGTPRGGSGSPSTTSCGSASNERRRRSAIRGCTTA